MQEINSLSKIIFDEISRAKKVLLHCHPNPDPDSISSVLAMAGYLKSLKKEVVAISGDSVIPLGLRGLPNFEWIVEKNFTQVDLKEFDLFLILDSSSPSQITKLVEVVFPDNLKTIVIDHHEFNKKYAHVNLVVPEFCSTSEVLFELFKLWDFEITKDIAACLYAGIYGDTGGFKYEATTYITLQKASELAKINPDFKKVIFTMENSVDPLDLVYQAIALSNLRKFYNNNLVLSVVTLAELNKHEIFENNFACDIATKLRGVVGWNICASVDEISKNVFGVSFRTRDSDKFDMSLLAKNIGVGGGGHRAAAGTRINGTVEEAVAEIASKVEEFYPDFKNLF